MRKIMAIAMSMAVAASLAACSTNEKVSDTTNIEKEEPSEIVNTTEQNIGTELEVDPEAVVVTVPTVNDRLAYVIDSARSLEMSEAFKVETTNDNSVLTLLGIDESMVEEYAITYSAMNVDAYNITIIKPVAEHEIAVGEAVLNYKETKIRDFESYLPDQLEIAQTAVTFNENGYYVLVMCQDADVIAEAIKTSLADIDEIIVDPTVFEGLDETADNSTENTEKIEETAEDVAEAIENAADEDKSDSEENTKETDTETTEESTNE